MGRLPDCESVVDRRKTCCSKTRDICSLRDISPSEFEFSTGFSWETGTGVSVTSVGWMMLGSGRDRVSGIPVFKLFIR